MKTLTIGLSKSCLSTLFVVSFLGLCGHPDARAADPNSEYSLEPSFNGGRINMGAYGNTPVASKYIPQGTIFMIH